MGLKIGDRVHINCPSLRHVHKAKATIADKKPNTDAYRVIFDKPWISYVNVLTWWSSKQLCAEAEKENS